MHIALVEPGKIGRTLMTRLLEARGDTVAGFADGMDAYRHLCGSRPVDVLITSVEVPGMNGLELCWNARTLTALDKRLHIIVMSSNHELESVVKALDSGADDFIRKPPVAAELNARLRAAERLVQVHDKLIDLATRDSLTHMLNRRAFFERAGSIVAEAGNGNPPASAIMLDIDHFKSVNDNYGHQAGDMVIAAVAGLLNLEDGLQARLGGEEFVVLLPETVGKIALVHAERLRVAIEKLEIESEGRRIRMTCSFGVAETLAFGVESIDGLLVRADGALYESKHNGRNRVTLAGEAPPTGAYSQTLRRPAAAQAQ